MARRMTAHKPEPKKVDEIKEFEPDKSVENLSDNAKKLYFAFNKTRNIFHALDTSIFNSWSEDIDYLTGAIKFRLLDTD